MFAVANSRFSTKDYNTLPDIMAADAAIMSLRDELQQLVDRGSEACRSTLFARGATGAFLLHRHWEVQEWERMVEHPGHHPSGKPALITTAQPYSGQFRVAPHRFKIDPLRRELLPLEFSSDEFVVRVWSDLIAQPSYLQSVCEVVGDSGLADKVGFSIFARDTVRPAQGEDVLEENWDHRSVLSAQVLVAEQNKVLVQTGWPFISGSDAAAASSSCIAYCMSVAGRHCSHHYAPTLSE